MTCAGPSQQPRPAMPCADRCGCNPVIADCRMGTLWRRQSHAIGVRGILWPHLNTRVPTNSRPERGILRCCEGNRQREPQAVREIFSCCFYLLQTPSLLLHCFCRRPPRSRDAIARLMAKDLDRVEAGHAKKKREIHVKRKKVPQPRPQPRPQPKPKPVVVEPSPPEPAPAPKPSRISLCPAAPKHTELFKTAEKQLWTTPQVFECIVGNPGVGYRHSPDFADKVIHRNCECVCVVPCVPCPVGCAGSAPVGCALAALGLKVCETQIERLRCR